MCASTDEIPLSLVYGSEATVLPIRNEVFKEKRHFIPYSRESKKEYYDIQQGSQAWKK